MKQKLDKVFDKGTYILTLIAALLFLCIAAVLLINIILRAVFSSGVYGQYEIVQYGIMVCMAIGVSRTTYADKHIHVNMLTKRMNWRVRAILGFLARLLCTTMCVLGIYPFLNAAKKAEATYRTTDIFRFPLQYVYYVLFALLLLTAIVFFYQMCVCFAGIFVNHEEKDSETVSLTGSDT